MVLALSLTSLRAQDETPKPELGPEFRTFTARNGKAIGAKVVSRIDKETYSFETPEGKTYKLQLESFGDSDRKFLEFWLC